VLPNASKRLQ